jgi:transcriptional regulator with XRE-family HTH domain
MWLDTLKELKKAKGLSSKQIAEMTNLPERTVARVFSGDTPNPYADTLYRIVSVLGGSLDDILADSKAVVGSKTLAAVQNELDQATAELMLIKAENTVLNDKAKALETENELLKLKLAHKEELLALHNYYIKREGI